MELQFITQTLDLPMKQGYVRVKDLKPAPWQPESRTEEKELKKLMEDIRINGIMQPLNVTTEGFIADGHRRFACAKALGLEFVPVAVVTNDLDLEGKFATLNASPLVKTMKSRNWTEVFVNGGRVPEPDKGKLTEAARLVSMANMRKIATGRGSAASLLQFGIQAANYCGREHDDQFTGKAMMWMFKHKQQYIIRRALAMRIQPKTIIAAINKNKPLELKFTA